MFDTVRGASPTPPKRRPTVSGVNANALDDDGRAGRRPSPSVTAPRARRSTGSRPGRSGLRLGGATLADRRGLSAAGAVLVAFGLGLLGGVLDIVVSPGLGIGFALAFVAGCLLVALAVHREDLLAVVLMPPLLYLSLVLVSTAIVPTKDSGGQVNQLLVELVNAVVVSAPVLFLATAGTFLVALLRGWRRRRSGPALGRAAAPLS